MIKMFSVDFIHNQIVEIMFIQIYNCDYKLQFNELIFYFILFFCTSTININTNKFTFKLKM